MTDKELTNQAPELRRLAMKVASRWKDADAAEDIAQDAVLRLWAMRSELRSADNVGALVSKIAYRLCVDDWRKQRTVPLDTSLPLPDENSLSPAKLLEIAEDEEWLLQRISKLPPMQYQVLRLRQVERKSNAEIAAILGTNTNSVATLLSRARQKMLEEIKQRNKYPRHI